MQNHPVSLRLARLALLRARLARVEGASSRPLPPPPHPVPYREYEFALTPEHRRVTIACAAAAPDAGGAAPAGWPTPVHVSTSADPERILIRAPVSRGRVWRVALGDHGPEAREAWGGGAEEEEQAHAAAASAASAPATPPPPLEVEIPPRFCGLDVASAGGAVAITGAGVQEADVRVIVAAAVTATTTADATADAAAPATISATRLRCGDLVLDAGPGGGVRARELAASRLIVRGGGEGGVVLGRVSALDARVEAVGGARLLEVGALYGRTAALRLQGGGGGGGGGGKGRHDASSLSSSLPVLRVTQLACGARAADEYGGEQEAGAASSSATAAEAGATLEALGSGPVAVRVDGGVAGRARVASAGGPVSLAVQAGDLRGLLSVDSGGGDVDLLLDAGGGSVGGPGRQHEQQQQHRQQQRYAAVRVGGAAALSVDSALGVVVEEGAAAPNGGGGGDGGAPPFFQGRMPVSGGGNGGGDIAIDAGGRGRVSLRARSWMDGVMARARAAREAREAAAEGSR